MEVASSCDQEAELFGKFEKPRGLLLRVGAVINFDAAEPSVLEGPNKRWQCVVRFFHPGRMGQDSYALCIPDPADGLSRGR